MERPSRKRDVKQKRTSRSEDWGSGLKRDYALAHAKPFKRDKGR